MHKKTDTESRILSGNAKADSFYHTLEWLITAFAGTLVFIFFIMQVYRIPTGSMAETLRGAHFRLRCRQCGYRFDYDFRQDVYRAGENVTPRDQLPLLPTPPRCPSCGYLEPQIQISGGKAYVRQGERVLPGQLHTVYKGDQIFVLKCIYQFFEPKRWDVVVFKNPLEPKINYIKRLIAGPGQTVQLIDGDVYIDGHIQRKPAAVQDELWMPIYDNDFRPIRPEEPRFNGHAWRQPFENRPQSRWELQTNHLSVFALNADDGAVHRVRYNPHIGNDFRATYAYDEPDKYPLMPVCSDLMVRCYVRIGDDSAFGAHLGKYGIGYEGWIYADGRAEIIRIHPDGTTEVLAEGKCDAAEGPVLFRFANADHLLRLEYGAFDLHFDLGVEPDAAGTHRDIPPEVELAGVGKVWLDHIGVFRDIHYITDNIRRATEAEPLTLGPDEFFVCGDNSPYSFDSRLWDKPGRGNNGRNYREGIVPRDFLVGKAFFVHWPGGWRLKKEPLRWIPCPDGMKVIYGGN